MPDVDDLVDDDTVLSNVEEMLEGFEWRSGAASMSGGYADGMRSKGKADEIERSLVGELKALEAVSHLSRSHEESWGRKRALLLSCNCFRPPFTPSSSPTIVSTMSSNTSTTPSPSSTRWRF